MRSLWRKMPALGFRSPARPVQAVFPAAASRHMSHARPRPSLKQLEEEYNNSRAMLRQVTEDSVVADRIATENSRRILDEFEKRTNALLAVLYGASALLAIRQLNRRFRSSDDHLSM